MLLQRLLLSAGILLAATGQVLADGKAIVLGSFPIPVMVIDANTGVFVELAKEMGRRAGYAVTIEVAPPQRTVGQFGSGATDGVIPALAVTTPMPHARSESIYVKKDFVFTKAAKPVLTSIADLEGKSVGITLGYPYVAELTTNTKIKLATANTDEANFAKLDSDRIAAFVVEEKTGLGALKASKLSGITYDPAKPLSSQDVYIAFQNKPDGKAMAEKFSKALAEMKADGSFGKIMAKANSPK